MRTAVCWVALVGSLVSSFTSGCGSDGGGGGSALTITKLIGPEGGTVELAGGGKVTIPVGALAEATAITITKLEPADVAALPTNLEAAGKPFAFKPHGTAFLERVTIEVPFEGDASEVRPNKLDDEQDTSWQTVVGSMKDSGNTKLLMETTSFSVIVAARPDSNSGVITLPDGAIVEDGGSAGSGGNGGTGGLDAGGAGGAGGSGGSDAAVDAGDDAGTMTANLAQDAYLKSDNSETNDFFGHALALSGNTLVVGARYEASDGTGNNNNVAGAGAVYVFVYGAGAWTQQAMLKADVPEVNAAFGYDVGIDGDTIVVGALDEDRGASDSGSAYVFVRSGSTWSQQAVLRASNAGNFDHYGTSVAISGDTIVVGAPAEDSIAVGINNVTPGQLDESWNAAGAVYVHTRSGTTWSQQAYIKPSHPGVRNEWNEPATKEFGFDVAIDVDTIVVGAPGDDSNATGVNGAQDNNLALTNGAAYVFARSGGVWTEQAYLKTNDGMTFNYFGTTVAVAADIVAVGRQDTNSYAGGVYTFSRSGSTWSVQQTVLGDVNTSNHNFGSALAMYGNRMVVGANGHDGSNPGVNTPYTCCANDTGAGFEFVLSGNTWTQIASIKPRNLGFTGGIGYRNVAVSADAIALGAVGDGSNATGINGAENNNSAPASGAVYTFR